MEPKSTYIRSDNFVERELGGEKVLVPINQFGVAVQNIYTLNETAAAVWTLLSEKRTVDELVNNLATTYEDSEGIIRQDVELLLAEFVKESFVLDAGE